MDSSDDRDSEAPSGRPVKVARLIEAYDLDGFGEELERLWTADEPERKSLRDLADVFNQRLVEQAMADTGMQTIDGEVANVYRLLTDESVSGGDRTRVRRRLERDGVDIDALESDFVSYQAIRTYLTEYRDAEYVADDTDRLERDTQSIQQLRSRLETVTESKLDRLSESGRITLGEFRVMANLTVLCEDCGRQLGVDELLDEERCGCQGD